MVQEIETIKQFKDAIGTKSTGWVIIDVYGSWCPPCRAIAPKYAALAEKYPILPCFKLNSDIEELIPICQACEIESLPTFLFFRGGEYKTKIMGSNDKKLEQLMKQCVTSMEDYATRDKNSEEPKDKED